MPDEIRIGVAGAGVFGGYHAGKIAADDRAALVAVYDLNLTASETLASRFDCRAYRDFVQCLDAVDAVIIATPATTHAALAAEAISRGKHVFVEKPLALTRVDAEALIGAARAANVVLQVGHQERHVLAATGLFPPAERLISATIYRSSRPSARCRDVSTVFDLMIHDIDIVRQLTNSEITSIAVNGEYDDATARLTLADGAEIDLRARRGAASVERRMHLVFGSGDVEFDFVKRTLVNRSSVPLADVFGPRDDLVFADPLAYGASAFIDAVNGQSSVGVTAESVVGVVDWAEKIDALLECGAVSQNRRAAI